MTELTRRAVITGGLTSLLTLPARSETVWPTKPITLVHGYVPGGPTDVVARIVAEGLSRRLGQQVIVDPKPGAAGTIAAAHVARAASDGYTLIAMPGAHATTAALYRNLPYRAIDDFSMISLTAEYPFVFVTNVDHAFQSMPDLINAARWGKKSLLYGTPGTGTVHHLSVELLAKMANVQFQHIPYRGSAQVVTDLLTGRIDFMLDVPTLLLEYIRGGRLRALGVTNASRVFSLPDVPTISETALLDYVVTSWQGLGGPAGVPAAIVERVNRELAEILSEPIVVERLRGIGNSPRSCSPDEFRTRLAADIEKWAAVVAYGNIERI
jgi:tripartite-type tricarboxylate transporter receptor subunit TctC